MSQRLDDFVMNSAILHTGREQIRMIFNGIIPVVPPVCIRMDLWHQDAVSRGTLPGEWAGLSVAAIEDRLGFCRSARFRTKPHLEFPEGWVQKTYSGCNHNTIYNFPGDTLRKVEGRTHDQERAGMRAAVLKYPVSSESECRALLRAVERAALVSDLGGFAEFDAKTGDAGMPLLILGSCPVHMLMLEWFGYENFYYALADYPDVLGELIRAVERLFRSSLWSEVFASSAELILHGNHFADATTPPPLFKRFFLPYFHDFNSGAHAAGQRVLWHSDAAMGSLLQLVLDAGFDGADCLATAPLVPERLEDYYRVWQGRIVCWGGLPGIIFHASFPDESFDKYLRQLVEFISGKAGFIIGVSDNIMPGALWKRIALASEVCKN